VVESLRNINMSKVLENVEILKDHHRSMGVALSKATMGSPVEDGYFLEKLEKTANRMGFKLKKIKERHEH
jgi:hypothetical protein